MMDRFFKRLRAIAEGRAQTGEELDEAEDAVEETSEGT